MIKNVYAFVSKGLGFLGCYTTAQNNHPNESLPWGGCSSALQIHDGACSCNSWQQTEGEHGTDSESLLLFFSVSKNEKKTVYFTGFVTHGEHSLPSLCHRGEGEIVGDFLIALLSWPTQLWRISLSLKVTFNLWLTTVLFTECHDFNNSVCWYYVLIYTSIGKYPDILIFY